MGAIVPGRLSPAGYRKARTGLVFDAGLPPGVRIAARKWKRMPAASLKAPAPADFPIPHASEPYVVPIRWLVPVTVRRADVLWIVVPRPAPQNTFGRVPLL